MSTQPIPVPQDGLALRFLYHSVPGRAVLKLLSCRGLSALVGRFMDSPVSRVLVPHFLKANQISLDGCVRTQFRSFNDCFTRQLRPEARPICPDPDALISPCDGLLSVYPIREDTVLPIKQSAYRIPELLQDSALADDFRDGLCLVFRLCVHHYHRYCYLSDGSKGENHYIPGRLHTVRPIALREYPVFTENCREYTVMDTPRLGRVAQIEVGALLVGKIQNHDSSGPIRRGDEKGMFLYGGSTIVILLQKDAVTLPDALFAATEAGLETPVRMGEALGKCN